MRTFRSASIREPRRAARPRIGVLLFAALVGLGSFVGQTGCGSTGSKRFAFEARAGGIERDAAEPYSFPTETGWTVTLTKALVTVGPIYLNTIAPLHDETATIFPFRIKEAHAADEHLGEGRVAGEILSQITVDALSPAMSRFPTVGTITTEQIRTADVWLWPSPETPPESTKVETVTADLAGEAVRGGESVRFRGQLLINDAWTTDAAAGERAATPIASIRKVRGIASSFFPNEGGHLEIQVDLRPLFRGADFSNLAENPVARDGTTLLVQSKSGRYSTDQVMRNVFQGIRASAGTYTVRWISR